MHIVHCLCTVSLSISNERPNWQVCLSASFRLKVLSCVFPYLMLCVHNFNSLVLQLPAQNNSDQPEIVLIQTASIFFSMSEREVLQKSLRSNQEICLPRTEKTKNACCFSCVYWLSDQCTQNVQRILSISVDLHCKDRSSQSISRVGPSLRYFGKQPALRRRAFLIWVRVICLWNGYLTQKKSANHVALRN